MVFHGRNRAAVPITVGAPWIVSLIEVDGELALLDIGGTDVHVTAASVGLLAICGILERKEQMIAVLGHTDEAKVLINGQLQSGVFEPEGSHTILYIGLGGAAVGRHFKRFRIGSPLKCCGDLKSGIRRVEA